MALGELVAGVCEGLAGIVGQRLGTCLGIWATALRSDLPRLDGFWTASFSDPAAPGELLALEAHLCQQGRRLLGTGHVNGRPHDKFIFRGVIRRNVAYGSFSRADAQVLAGTGTFLLEVSADSRRLTGRCMWYDGVLEQVWVSPYCWHRLTVASTLEAC